MYIYMCVDEREKDRLRNASGQRRAVAGAPRRGHCRGSLSGLLVLVGASLCAVGIRCVHSWMHLCADGARCARSRIHISERLARGACACGCILCAVGAPWHTLADAFSVRLTHGACARGINPRAARRRIEARGSMRESGNRRASRARCGVTASEPTRPPPGGRSLLLLARLESERVSARDAQRTSESFPSAALRSLAKRAPAPPRARRSSWPTSTGSATLEREGRREKGGRESGRDGGRDGRGRDASRGMEGRVSRWSRCDSGGRFGCVEE